MSANPATVYTTLVAIGIVMSVILALLLVFSTNAFVILFALYVIAISIYNYVYLVRNPGQATDVNYNVNKFIALFNIALCGCVVILSIVFATIFVRR